jgi:uncharacterized protein
MAGMLLALLPALLLTGCDAAPAKQPVPAKQSVSFSYPRLTGRVVDAANVIPAPDRAALEQELAAAESKTRHQMVVVTVAGLGGHDISDYGVGLGRHWGIGRKDVNDGVLLIVAPNEHKVRIEVGYGLEGVLRDEEAAHIIRDDIVPRFEAGDLPGGIAAGTKAILHEIDVPGATP